VPRVLVGASSALGAKRAVIYRRTVNDGQPVDEI